MHHPPAWGWGGRGLRRRALGERAALERRRRPDPQHGHERGGRPSAQPAPVRFVGRPGGRLGRVGEFVARPTGQGGRQHGPRSPRHERLGGVGGDLGELRGGFRSRHRRIVCFRRGLGLPIVRCHGARGGMGERHVRELRCPPRGGSRQGERVQKQREGAGREPAEARPLLRPTERRMHRGARVSRAAVTERR